MPSLKIILNRAMKFCLLDLAIAFMISAVISCMRPVQDGTIQRSHNELGGDYDTQLAVNAGSGEESFSSML